MKKRLLFPCLCLMAMILFTHSASGKEEPKVKEINAGKIAMSLSLKYSGMSRRFIEAEGVPPWFAPMIVIWEDGRILCGEYDKEKDDWTYRFGKIDAKAAEFLQKVPITSYRLARKNVDAWIFGPDATTYFLRTKFDDGYFIINTWEQFDNAKHEPRRVIIKSKDTTDGKPVYLPEFYDSWKKVKKTVTDAGEKAVAKDAVPIRVVVEHYVLNIMDKDGNVLLRQDFSENFRPKK